MAKVTHLVELAATMCFMLHLCAFYSCGHTVLRWSTMVRELLSRWFLSLANLQDLGVTLARQIANASSVFGLQHTSAPMAMIVATFANRSTLGTFINTETK